MPAGNVPLVRPTAIAPSAKSVTSPVVLTTEQLDFQACKPGDDFDTTWDYGELYDD